MPAELKYNQQYHDDWAWSLAIKGATDQEIADAFGISRRTLIRWRQKYDTLGKAIEEGKHIADSKVEKSLYLRATGYEVEDTERTVDIDKDGNPKPVRIKTINKHVAPDTMAIMYWLNNRDRKNWVNRQEVEVSANENADDVVIYLPANGRDSSG